MPRHSQTHWSRISKICREEGLLRFGRRILEKIWRLFIDHRVLLVFEDLRDGPFVQQPLSDLVVQQWGKEQLPDIAGFLGFEPGSRKHRVVLERFDREGECYVAVHGGTPAAMVWTVRKYEYIPEIDLTLELKVEAAMMIDAVTLPQFRGLGIYPHLMRYVQDRCKLRGLRVYVICMSTNTPSLRGIQKAGLTHVSSRHYLRVLGIRVK